MRPQDGLVRPTIDHPFAEAGKGSDDHYPLEDLSGGAVHARPYALCEQTMRAISFNWVPTPPFQE
jgi:hypothetical protein